MASFLAGLAAVGAIYFSTLIVYRLYGSAASHVPGPFLARISAWWQLWHVWQGDYHLAIGAAHRKYGRWNPRRRVTARATTCFNANPGPDA